MQQKIDNIEVIVNELKISQQRDMTEMKILMKDHFDHCIIVETKANEQRLSDAELHNRREDDLLKKLDDRYAGKLTQTIVFGASGVILFAVFSALVYLVINKP